MWHAPHLSKFLRTWRATNQVTARRRGTTLRLQFLLLRHKANRARLKTSKPPFRIRWRRVSCVARQCGRRVSIKAWSVETHDGQAKLWCNRTDNQHCRFCVQDCRSFHVEAPFTFEARCTPEPYDTAIAPVRPCRGRTFGIASRRTSIIGNDSGLL